MTPLRQRMIHELELQRKAPGTVSGYVKAVEKLARYYRRSPDRISTDAHLYTGESLLSPQAASRHHPRP